MSYISILLCHIFSYSILIILPTPCLELRCNGVDNGCCTKETPCVEGDGDCDNDAQCAGDLTCSAKCPWGDNDECCAKPSKSR